MSVTPRPKLTPRPTRVGLLEEAADRPLPLALHDFALPCRRFVVEHKIAEVGKVSVTAEFLLRLVKNLGSCTEEEAASFFGYSRREMSYVLNEVESEDFVERSNGRLTLTGTGNGLFSAGDDQPAIYEVEKKSVRVGFDLLSLAPQERSPLSLFEIKLPELPVQDAKRVSDATEHIPNSFRRFYSELAVRTDPATTPRRSLYSIDAVSAKERFSAIVRVQVNSTGLRPTVGEVDLTDWRPDFELADREAISMAAAKLVESLTVNARGDDGEAYDQLIELAPEFMKDFTRRDGLSVERFYRYAYASHGDVRSDRPTVPLLGSLFTLENARRFVDVIGYGLKRMQRPAQALFWVVPQVPLWGSCAVLPEILDRTVERLAAANADMMTKKRIETAALTAVRPEKWIGEAFSNVFASERRALPGGLELVLVPGAFVAAMVHAPIGAASGLAVPLGFTSFDPKVVARATDLLRRTGKMFHLTETLLEDLEPMTIG
ncbi:hypothetical protein FSB78_10615 [Sphingomonas ginsenosidivorax]|uniref:Uncharacterized protein n=1 Tax=Sphingomonas ginsenosidivorax TaxID=862135 RepID=A0A5C6UEY4_9SPHN|nr:hypothetical protein [Sphingomonas ginsenosidivorax]TXC71343.1 hypothetical protein FSB78_10615 [Sphingomonas ginsenosidivorax]